MNEEELKELEAIKKEYSIKTETDLDKIKRFDRKAKNPALVFGYTFGVISSLVLGTGMSLSLEAIGTTQTHRIIGYVVGTIGIIMCLVNPLIYNKMIKHGKKKYGSKILELTNKALGE